MHLMLKPVHALPVYFNEMILSQDAAFISSFEELIPEGKSGRLIEQGNEVYLKQIIPSTEYSLYFLMWLVKETKYEKYNSRQVKYFSNNFT